MAESQTARGDEFLQAGADPTIPPPTLRLAHLAVPAVLVLASVIPAAGQVQTLEPGAFEGYTLLSPVEPTYDGPIPLVDMEGNLVHTWDLKGFPAVMLPGGSVLGGDGYLNDLPLGGSMRDVVQVGWDGAIELAYSDFTVVPGVGSAARMAHDIQRAGNPVGYYAPGQEPDPEGSTLVLGFVERTAPDLAPGVVFDGVLYEIDFEGRVTWTWSAIDHIHELGFRQAIFDDIARYGGHFLVLNAASRLGPNRHHRAGDPRFHPDNILINSRNQAFMAIVDRETGRIVWTLGPEYESEAERALEPIIGAHQPHLIPEGLPGAGNLLVLDNGFNSGYGGSPFVRAVVEAIGGILNLGGADVGYRYQRDYSRVLELDPVTLEIIWAYDPRLGDDLTWSPIVGGVQRLPNGNTLITSGFLGRVLEVTPDKRIVWDYESPYRGTLTNTLYRATRVPPEYLPPGANAADYPRWGGGSSGGCSAGPDDRPGAGALPGLLLALAVLRNRGVRPRPTPS